jgi:Mg-chelatase subunit ChlD
VRTLFTIGIFVMILAATASAASLQIVTPPDGAQLFGPQAIEAQVERPPDRINFYVDGALVGVRRSPPWRVMHDFGEYPSPRTIVAEAYFDGFKVVERARVISAGLSLNDAISVDLVELAVRIRSSKPDVKPSDLRLSENGIRQTISEVRAERPVTSFLFVVDRSLSMNDGKLDAALGAVRSALRSLRPGDTASLVLFNHRAEREVPLQNARALDLIGSVQPAGGTSVRDTLAAIEAKRRTVVIVISDGGDRNSTTSESAALRSLAGHNLALFALTLGNGGGADFLAEAAERTGGTVTRSSAGSLKRDLDAVMRDVNSRYTVIYQSSLTEPGWREIAIHSKGQASVSAARRGYYAR